MSLFPGFFLAIKNTELESTFKDLKEKIDFNYSARNHGDVEKWLALQELLPEIVASEIALDRGQIIIGRKSDCDDNQRNALAKTLLDFQPWRKGPFNLFGIDLDTEWRSDWKWDRLKNEISSLKGKAVLDVGCGNGYYCLRMLGAGARQVVGVDPTLLFVSQFMALNKFIKTASVHVLPLTLEDLPANQPVFDTVFSMGVLYHRKFPLEHLAGLYGLMRAGAELVLETLIIDGDEEKILAPDGRYAKMRNVWQLPTVSTLETWLVNTGFKEIRLVDITVTTIAEQRCTDWMKFESLENFLDPKDHSLTIEGFPAPRRALVIAKKI